MSNRFVRKPERGQTPVTRRLNPLSRVMRGSDPGTTHHRGPTPDTLGAWEMLEPGRYMPRRIRGSFPGRELG
jgi:hypothetical protein